MRDFEPTFGVGGVMFENEFEIVACVSGVCFLFSESVRRRILIRGTKTHGC
jgi:hypothetical protein